MYIWRAVSISYPLQNFKLEPSKNTIVAICKITSVIFSSFTLAPQQLQTVPLRKQFPFNWQATTATKMSAAYAETNNYTWNRKGYWYTTPNSQIKPSSKALHKNMTQQMQIIAKNDLIRWCILSKKQQAFHPPITYCFPKSNANSLFFYKRVPKWIQLLFHCITQQTSLPLYQVFDGNILRDLTLYKKLIGT